MKRTGTWLGIPFDWRRPTWRRIKASVWSPDDPRWLVPRAFGAGWTINFARLLGRRRS